MDLRESALLRLRARTKIPRQRRISPQTAVKAAMVADLFARKVDLVLSRRDCRLGGWYTDTRPDGSVTVPSKRSVGGEYLIPTFTVVINYKSPGDHFGLEITRVAKVEMIRSPRRIARRFMPVYATFSYEISDPEAKIAYQGDYTKYVDHVPNLPLGMVYNGR